MSQNKVPSAAERSAARLAVVQALYQMDVAGIGLTAAFAEYETYWIGQEVEGIAFQPADREFFRDVLAGVVHGQKTIDPMINSSLTPSWPLTRVVPVLRSILRAGTYELMERKDIPARVVISEYLDVTRSFYDEDEPGLVNAVLDTIARSVREGELDKKKKADAD